MISERLTQPTHGFDYLRLALATGVLAYHSYALGGHVGPTPPWIQAWAGLMVPMFFAVSGFLVAGSVERHNLRGYFALRALRLLPALTFSTVLTALVLGPLITTSDDYFSSPQTWTYLTNSVGFQQPLLPGVFTGNPGQHTVNGSLWTIGWEMLCYWLLAIASLLLFRWRWAVLAVLVLATVLYGALNLDLSMTTGALLVLCFSWGTALYLFRDLVSASIPLTLAALLFAVLVNYAGLTSLTPLPDAVAAVGLGLIPAPKLRADYSYGVYVFAFPVQQTLFSFGVVSYWPNASLSLAATLICAAVSWHLVEGPALKHKPATLAWLNRPRPGTLTADYR